MKKIKDVIMILIGILVMLFLIFGVCLPLSKRNIEIRKKIHTHRAELRKVEKRRGELELIKQEYLLIEEQLKELEEKLEKRKDVPYVLKTIAKNAEKNGIDVVNLSIHGVVSHPAYDELPITITCNSNYHSLANFISDICQEEKIFSVRDLRISKITTGERDITIAANFTILFYIFK